MTDPDLTAFLLGFAAVWGGLGLYLLHLHRRMAALERQVASREPRRGR